MTLSQATRALTALTALATLAACVPPMGVQRASTLGRGELEVSADLDGFFPAAPAGARFDGPPMPSVSVGAAYGLTDRVDLGVAGGLTSGVELRSKLRLDSGASPSRVLSLAPAASLGGNEYGKRWQLSAPLLLGYKPRDRVELVLSPRPTLIVERWGRSQKLTVGVSMGGAVAFQLNERWWLTPQAVWHPRGIPYSIVEALGAGTSVEEADYLQVSLGFSRRVGD